MLEKFLLTLTGVVALGSTLAWGHDNDMHGRAGNLGKALIPAPVDVDPVREAKAREYFTDLPVVTQHGERLRFFSDLLKDRVVVVTLFYTQCTGMCPLTNQKLSQVQDILGEQFGRNFFFLSVSLDPETDTPEVLKDYAAKFGARDGWFFLTGKKDHLKTITYRLGQTNPAIEAHVPYFMLGNVPAARWTKVRPNEPALAVAERLRLLAHLPAGN